MGLQERRALKEFQEKKLPGLQKQIDDLAGKSIPLEIKWDQLAIDAYDHLYAEAWAKVYFEPTIAALKQICRDDMGKSAVKDGLAKIAFCNESGSSWGGSAITFADKTLKIDHEPVSNLEQIEDRTKFAVKALEAGL